MTGKPLRRLPDRTMTRRASRIPARVLVQVKVFYRAYSVPIHRWAPGAGLTPAHGVHQREARGRQHRELTQEACCDTEIPDGIAYESIGTGIAFDFTEAVPTSAVGPGSPLEEGTKTVNQDRGPPAEAHAQMKGHAANDMKAMRPGPRASAQAGDLTRHAGTFTCSHRHSAGKSCWVTPRPEVLAARRACVRRSEIPAMLCMEPCCGCDDLNASMPITWLRIVFMRIIHVPPTCPCQTRPRH